MRCPYCHSIDTKVVDSRPTEDYSVIRRRRECNACGQRITTYEKIEEVPLVVVKKDGNREQFNKSKILNGIIRACEKRPITLAQMEALADEVEAKVQSSLEKEVSTIFIGEQVMDGLKKLDEVAYVRFASVYREFKDIDGFYEELRRLIEERTDICKENQ